MNLRHVLLAGICCLAIACGKTPPGEVGLGGACLRNSDCAKPFLCYDGVCQLDAAKFCAKDTVRCNGDAVEKCSATQDRWEVQTECATGCLNGACKQPICQPNETRCDGTFISQCLPNGSAWVTVQACPTECAMNGGSAECKAPDCTPFETQCITDQPGFIKTCNSRGTAFVMSQCSTDGEAVCVEGRCLPTVCDVSTSGTTTTREERCRGTVAEECNDTGTGWQAKEVCANGCEVSNGKATCPAAVCAPFSTKCKDLTTIQTCNRQGTQYAEASCSSSAAADDGRCVSGQCLPKVCTVTRDEGGNITDRQKRCRGDVLEQCSDTETEWKAAEVCEYGCGLTGGIATCEAPTCQPGEERCDGLALMRCNVDQSAFGFVQYCPSGCVANDTTSPATATCAAPACSPLSRKCGLESGTGTHYVELCKADGTGYERVENCPQTCSGGVCVVTNDTCVAGDIRCKGYEVEQCVTTAGGGSEWRFTERCLGLCGAGACDASAGSCGCEGGVSSTLKCGVPTRQAITLKALLPANTTVPCDGTSRVLVYSEPIVGATGIAVPDGTLVTFTHDGTDSLFASDDADPKAVGLQRPTLHGRATVLVKAPAADKCAQPRTLNVSASGGGRCTGDASVAFAAPGAERFVYLADDFSTTTYADRSITTAAWDTRTGAVSAVPAFELGTGVDGELNVASGTVDLAAAGYARAWSVVDIGVQDVSVDTVLPALSPGDEVLVIALAGTNANTIGNYEFKRVAAVSTGRIIFTEPVARVYGQGGNDDLSGQRVVVQRVPQFTNVTVSAGATLTTAAYQENGAGTGVLAFRATDTVRVLAEKPASGADKLGTISMENKGLPANKAHPLNTPSLQTYLLNRLLIGAGGAAAPGGGIVYITGRTVSFKSGTGYPVTSSASSVATIKANSTSGSGGTMWIGTGALEVGATSTRLFANGGTGRVRLDFGGVDNPNTNGNLTSPTVTTGYAYIGQNGAYAVQSTVMFSEATASAFSLRKAQLLGVVGGAGETKVVFPSPTSGGLAGANGSLLPQFSLQASADGGSTYGDITTGAELLYQPTADPRMGKSFKWKGSITTRDDQTVHLRGVAVRLFLN